MAAHVGNLIALAGAGVWGYFNFIKSRTYYPRLELTVSGEIRADAGQQYLVPRVTLKNIGRSKVEIIQRGSGYRVWIATAGAIADQESGELTWSGGKDVFDVFANHKWIEPDETIFDELQLFVLPSNCLAAKVQARLVAPIGWPYRTSSEWNCSTVVGPFPSEEREKP